MQKTFSSKMKRLFIERREWAPRLIRGAFLFHFTRIYRCIIPFPHNISLGKNVRVQWPTCLLAELPESRISIGDHSIVYENAMIESYGKGHISIGECAVIGDNRIYSRGTITIGKRVVTSWNVMIQDFDPHPIHPELRKQQIEKLAHDFAPKFAATKNVPGVEFDFSPGEITIGDDVWIGANAIILKGARIGDGCVVAAGSVVVKGDYAPRSIIAGNPAKVVKSV